jgi:hypothetical protein
MQDWARKTKVKVIEKKSRKETNDIAFAGAPKISFQY